MKDVLRTDEEEALINALVAGEISGLIAVCPTCEERGRLVVVSDEDGPVDACCRRCADRPPLDMTLIEAAVARVLLDRGRESPGQRIV